MATIIPIRDYLIPAAPRAVTGVKAAHLDLLGRLSALRPHLIAASGADPADLEDRADHVNAIVSAVRDYVGFIVVDTGENCPAGTLQHDYCDAILSDLASEIAGEFIRAANQIREDNARFGVGA